MNLSGYGNSFSGTAGSGQVDYAAYLRALLEQGGGAAIETFGPQLNTMIEQQMQRQGDIIVDKLWKKTQPFALGITALVGMAALAIVVPAWRKRR